MTVFKNKLKAIASLAAVAMFTIFTSCGNGSDDPSATEAALKILKSKTWQISSVTVDGTDRTPDFAGMTIAFTDDALTTANGGVLWQPRNTWQFMDNRPTAIQLGDGLEVRLVTLTKSSLITQITWNKNTYGPGRIASIQGQYVFSFE